MFSPLCLGEKPGFDELSESLTTAAGWISSPGKLPLPTQPFPDPEGPPEPAPAEQHYLCCSP